MANFNISIRAAKHTCLHSMHGLIFLALPHLAWALVTGSGTPISNFATVNYVIGTSSPAVATSNSVQFVVDKKIDLLVAETTGLATLVNSPQPIAVTTFKITNLGNDAQNFNLVAAMAAPAPTPAPNGTAPFISNTFNANSLTIYMDAAKGVSGNTVGVYDPGIDTLITTIPNLTAGATSPALFVVGNIPNGILNGQQSVVSLTATATALNGTALTSTLGADTPMGVDTVFADIAGVTDGIRDGKHSAYAAYLASVADMVLSKTIVSVTTSSGKVVTNPASGDPAIRPGSTITYQLVASFTGAGTITNLVITDDLLPTNTTYVPNSITVNGVAQTDAADSPIDNTSFAGSTVTVTRGTVTVPAPSVTIQFKATIN